MSVRVKNKIRPLKKKFTNIDYDRLLKAAQE